MGSLRVRGDPLAALRAASLCVASGKGGTGKSVVTASLATLFARRGPTLLVDADLGAGNAHILQGVTPEHSFVEVVEGTRRTEEIVTRCGRGLDLLAGGSGYARLAGLSTYELHVVACGLERLELAYRTVLVDSAAGLSEQTVSFAAAADVVLLVTTPDVTALTDAYAFLKVLLQRSPSAEPLLVVNRATSEDEGRAAAERIRGVSSKFLARAPRFVASLPEDRAAFRSVQQRRPVTAHEPDSPLAGALARLAEVVEDELAHVGRGGIGRQLLRHVGYSPERAR